VLISFSILPLSQATSDLQLFHDDAEVEDEDVPAPSFLPYLILPEMCTAASLSAS